MEEAVNATAWYRIGEDNKVYEKVSIHCDWYDVLEVATYADILKKYEVVGAFVENGEFYYTKVMDGDRDCPFADNGTGLCHRLPHIRKFEPCQIIL